MGGLNINLNELRDKAYKIACDSGFHDKELSDRHFLMLVITELSEAVEADRKGKMAQRVMFEENCNTPQKDPEGHWIYCFNMFIKDSVNDELADAVIRLLDLAGYRNIKIDDLTDEKIEDLSNIFGDKTFTEIMYVICSMPHEGDLCNTFKYPLYYVINAMISIIMGLAKYLDIDLIWHVEQKMKYNSLRSKMYGKKY